MIQINKSKNILRATVAGFFVLAIVATGFVATQHIASAAPATINVTIFNHEDSHPDPGDGCSLYEASIAASTAVAYGGCEAGSVDGNTVVLGEGTYMGPGVGVALLDLDFNNTSLMGVSTNGTILDGYNITLSGDQESSVENLTLTDTAIFNSVHLYIAGSNKTVENVSILRPVTAQSFLRIDPNSSTVENVTIRNVIVESIAGSLIHCAGACSDIVIDNVEVASPNSQAGVEFGTTSGVTIEGLSMNSPNSANLAVGADSIIEDVNVNTNCGGNTITVGAGTIASNINQVAATGCGLSFNGSALSVTNLYQYMGGSGGLNFYASADTVSGLTQSMNGFGSVNFSASVREVTDYQAEGGNWSFNNSYDGSAIRNLQSSPSGGGTSFTAFAQTLENILIDKSLAMSDGGILFYNTRDDAVIEDISLINSVPGQGSNSATIYGENVNIDNFVIDSHPNAAALLSIEDPGVSISNLLINGGRLILNDAGNATVENFSISNSIPGIISPSIYIPSSTGDVTIRNGLLSNVAGGVYVSGDFFDPVGSLLVENVQFNNLQGDGAPQGAIYASGIDEVTIRDVTSNRTINPDQQGTISIYSGSNHKISNTTLVDGTGGIAVFQGVVPINVDVNNVTIVNNEDSAEHQETDYPFAIHAALTGETGLVSVSNSLIGGASPYVECSDNTMPNTNLVFTNTLATHPSCVDFGATLVSNFDNTVSTLLAGNSNQNDDIGYNGSFGNLQTLALLSTGNNQALSAGDSTTCEATDARGVARPDGLCDLGAFQLSATAVGGGEEGDNDGSQEYPNAPNTGLERLSSPTAVALVATIILIAVGAAVYRRLRA